MNSTQHYLDLLREDLREVVQDLSRVFARPGREPRAFPEVIATCLFSTPDGKRMPLPSGELVLHFLETYVFWDELSERVAKHYAGHQPDKSDDIELRDESERLLQKISDNWEACRQLDVAFARRVSTTDLAELLGSGNVIPTEDTVDAIVATEESLRILNRSRQHFKGLFSGQPSQVASQLSALKEFVRGMHPSEKSRVLEELRLSRRRSLAYATSTGDHDFYLESDQSMQNIDALIQSILEDPRTPDLGDRVGQALRSALGAIGNLGYDGLVDNIIDGFYPGSLVPGTSGDANCSIIPSENADHSQCTPVLLAFSKGATGALGFDGILQKVRTCLARCRGTTKLVLFFCTTWNAEKFTSTHFPELQALAHADGVRFGFLVVGSPPNRVAVVPVDL